MTEHTPDSVSPDSVSPEQLASEPAVAALYPLRLTATDFDALVSRIEASAEPELARRRRAFTARTPAPPPLVVTRTSKRFGARRSADRDVMPLLARAVRPALLAAAAATLFAVGLSRQGAGAAEATGQQVSDASAVQALSLHDPSAQWPDQARAPSVDALGRAIGLGGAP